MPVTRLASLLFFIAAFLFAAPVDAQMTRRDSGLYIRGYVRADPNRAVENVKVELKRETGQILNSDFTRFNGQFEFFGLSIGVYVLEVYVEGFHPVRQVVEISAQPGLAGVILMLHPTTTARENVNPAGGSVSARELAIPKDARASYQLGEEQLRKNKNADQAIQLFKKALTRYPEYYEAHQMMGVVYLEQGKQEDAEAAFRKSIAVSTESYGPAYFGLASLLCDQEKFDEAEPLARRAVDLDDKAWQGHYELARSLAGLGRVEEAETRARQAIEKNSELARGYLLLAKIHQALNNYPAMLGDLDEFLRREPRGTTSDDIRKTRALLARRLKEAGMQVPDPPDP